MIPGQNKTAQYKNTVIKYQMKENTVRRSVAIFIAAHTAFDRDSDGQ